MNSSAATAYHCDTLAPGCNCHEGHTLFMWYVWKGLGSELFLSRIVTSRWASVMMMYHWKFCVPCLTTLGGLGTPIFPLFSVAELRIIPYYWKKRNSKVSFSIQLSLFPHYYGLTAKLTCWVFLVTFSSVYKKQNKFWVKFLVSEDFSLNNLLFLILKDLLKLHLF